MICSQLGNLGRLGNQLWQIAGTLGLSFVDGNMPPFFPKWDYEPYFSIPNICFSDELHGEESYVHATRLHPNERMYLQDYGLFGEWEDDVRELLAPSELARQQLYSRFGAMLVAEASEYTSVHVRRGDYLGVSDHHPVLPVSYYLDAMGVLEGPYMVFSDDIAWCKSAFAGALSWSETVYIDGVPREVGASEFTDHQDLLLMSLCDRHIIANSSYSWWGAFLTLDAQVVYPGTWYGPAATTADASLMFPESWTEIEVKE